MFSPVNEPFDENVIRLTDAEELVTDMKKTIIESGTPLEAAWKYSAHHIVELDSLLTQ